MANKFNVAQCNAIDSDNRNQAAGVGGSLSLSSVLNDLYSQIGAGSVGIKSLAADVDALALGGGALTYDPDSSSQASLIFAFKAGRFHNGYTVITVSAGNVTLSASSTNYIEVDRNGTVYCNSSGFTAGRYPVYTVAAGTSSFSTPVNARALIVLIGPAGVTGVMLSTAGATKEIDKSLGSISTTTSFIFLASVTGVVKNVVFADATSVTASDTNYWTISLKNKSNSGVDLLDTGTANTTKATGGTGMTAYASRPLTLNATTANLNVNLNDVMELTFTATGSPTAMSECCARIDIGFTG